MDISTCPDKYDENIDIFGGKLTSTTIKKIDERRNDDANIVIKTNVTTVQLNENEKPSLSTVIEFDSVEAEPTNVTESARSKADGVEEARSRMIDCAQELLAVVEPPPGTAATGPRHGGLIAYSPRPIRKAPIASPTKMTTRQQQHQTVKNKENGFENSCYNYYPFHSNTNGNDVNKKSPEATKPNNSDDLDDNFDCQLLTYLPTAKPPVCDISTDKRRTTLAAEMDDLLRHYGDYLNNNDLVGYGKSISNDSVHLGFTPYSIGPILAYNPLCASPLSSTSISSRRASNNNSITTSAYSSRSTKSTTGSELIASNVDIWPSASSPTTPTSPTLPSLRGEPLAPADFRGANSLNSSGKPDSLTDSEADGQPYPPFDHSPLSTRSESFQRVYNTQKSLLPLTEQQGSATRSCFSLDAGRRYLNQFGSASTSTANLIEMQSAVVVDWMKEKAAVRLDELFRVQTARAKSAASPAKRRLIARFDVDLFKGVRNAVKSAKSTIDAPKKSEPSPTIDSSESNGKTYGLPLSTVNARTDDGSPLPRFLRDIMTFLADKAAETVGIFRKNGVKGRIMEIRDCCDALGVNGRLPDDLCTDAQLYNLADAFKQYLRDLPECVMTKRVSTTMESCIIELPESKHLLAIHYCLLLLPSENREALMIILRFLGEICFHSAKNQMSAENLATCLMPSLFYLPHSGPTTKLSRRKTIGTPSERERNAYNALKEALTKMIRDHEYLLTVPAELTGELRVLRAGGGDAAVASLQVPLKNGVFDLNDEFQRKLRHRLGRLKNNHLGGWKNWRLVRVYGDGTQLMARNARNLMSPTEFIVQTTVNTSANRLHALLLHERHVWDHDVEMCQRVGSAGPDSDVIEVTYNGLSVKKRVYLARRWTYGSVSGSGGISSLAERSVMPAGVRDAEPRVLVFKSDFLIVPDDMSSRRCQLIYLSRIDLKGKSLEWYNVVYGEMIAERIRRLKTYFINETGLPPLPPRRCSASHSHNLSTTHVETIV